VKSKLREVRVQDAVGLVLAHDLTQVIPGKYKGPLFRKGHVISEQDIEPLLDIGKAHIYVMELAEGELHENDAAERIARAAGDNPHLEMTSPKEGKVNLVSSIDGLLRVRAEAVAAINQVEHAVLSTLRTYTPVRKGDIVAAARVIPLIYPEERVKQVEAIGRQSPVVEVLPYQSCRVGIVTTGSEVLHGRIEDKFGPVLREKLRAFGAEVISQTFSGDDRERIQQQIRSFLEQGADLVLVTGGMSVDPDDRTPGAIASMGAEVVSYGTPMLPGSMLMVAYYQGVPVLGLPGCVIHDDYTSFDVFLPRILAGERIKKADIIALGHGGLHSC
jgi:molybdenum cofactor synthesis domain-containing protein